MRSPAMLAVGCALLVSAACGSESDNAESAPASTAATAVSTASIATIPTTVPAVTSPATSSPSSIAATSTAAAVTSTTLAVGERGDELLVVWASGVLAIHDPDTGRLRGVVARVATDGQYAYGPVRGGDGTTYMGMGVEDSWYSCEMVEGAVMSLSDEGEFATIGSGGGAIVSADGRHLAYVRSSECRPDPVEPDFSFVSVPDTVVVRDLATDEERSWTFPGAYDDQSLSAVVDSIVWYGDSLLAFVGGRLVRIDPSDPAVPVVADGTAVRLSADAPDYLALLGARSDGTIVAAMNVVEPGDTTLRIVTLDPVTGRVIAEVAALQLTLPDVDPSGTRWTAIINGTVIVDGRETTLEAPPLPPELVADFQDRPDVVGW
jgi:hypothetical protein